MTSLRSLLSAASGQLSLSSPLGRWALAVSDLDPKADLSTIAGKQAANESTPGMNSPLSGMWQLVASAQTGTFDPDGDAQASASALAVTSGPIVPTHVRNSVLDGTSIAAPEVLVNQDTHGAMQNEPSIAIDPGNPNRIVIAANDFVTSTWDCFVDGVPCSVVFSADLGFIVPGIGSYYSNDGGATWCCASSSPGNVGTLLPGTMLATNGPYDSCGDPVVAFNSMGEVFASGIAADLFSAPNAVFVSKGTFDGGGNLTWANPTFIAPTTSPSTFNDKDWMAIDANALSPFKDRIYVSWTRFVFNPNTNRNTSAQMQFAYSSDGGASFSSPISISGNVKFGQGSYIAVAPSGDIYVFWVGGTKKDDLPSVWVVKSTNGGVSFSDPMRIVTTTNVLTVRDTNFRVANFPSAAVAPNGDIYATWVLEIANNAVTFEGKVGCEPSITPPPVVRATCHAAAVFVKSTDGGNTWSAPALVFTPGNRTPQGYPQALPNGGTLNAPPPTPIEDMFPAVAVSATGQVYIGAYRSDFVSPWEISPPKNPVIPLGVIDSIGVITYVNNGRLDYVVRNLGTTTQIVSTHPINTRYVFQFMGDYTDMKVGSDGFFHAAWCDTNNVQPIKWFCGLLFDETVTQTHQMDIATNKGNF